MQPTDSLRADADTLQHLMMQASQLARRHLADIISASNLTVPQYFALSVVRRTPEGCTMTALADATHQVSATMTGIIDRLGDRGLVERRADPNDRRSRRVYLTTQGGTLMDTIDQQRQAQMLFVLDTFSPEERQFLISLMDKYLQAMHSTPETLEITTARTHE